MDIRASILGVTTPSFPLRSWLLLLLGGLMVLWLLALRLDLALIHLVSLRGSLDREPCDFFGQKKLAVLAGLQGCDQPGGSVAQSIRIAHRWTFYHPNK